MTKNHYIAFGLLAILATFALNYVSQSTARDDTHRYKKYKTNKPYDKNYKKKHNDRRYKSYKRRNTAGEFDYYALAMSWSPTYCAKGGYAKRDAQCTRSRPFNFVLHGLWPQHQRGWPSNCAAKHGKWIPKNIINNMLDIMPAKGLIIHEWRKHGTCSGLSPRDYFHLSRLAFEKVKIPPMFQKVNRPITISVRDLENQFLKANPKLKADMISIACGRRYMTELRVCFDKKGEFTKCGMNETQSKVCRSNKVLLPAARTVR